MRRYDNYLDSNIEWLGSNPMGWQIKRAKDIFEYINRGTSPDYVEFSDYGVVNQATFSKGFFDISNLRYTSKFNRLSVLKDKDILIASTGGGVLGKTFYVDNLEGNYLADSHVTILRSKEFVNFNKYFYYFFSINYNLINQHLALGSTNQTELQKKYINNFKLFAPPFSEQQAIANYLDAKTQAIDKKVSLLEQKIETYKKLKRTLINQTITKGLRSLSEVEMKDSGISWIGQIPQHWEVKRLKELGNIETSSINKKIEEDEDLVKLVNYTDVYSNLKREIWNNDDYMIVSANKLQISSKKLKQGDVLFTPSSETINDIGVSAVVMENLHNTLYSYHLLRLRFRKVVDLHFKKYLFSNDYVQYYFSKSATGTTRKILGLNTFNNLIIPLPPKSEQEEIAKYLDHKTATIDAIVSNIGKQIDTLKQLRKTLINDVVTGKIKVVD